MGLHNQRTLRTHFYAAISLATALSLAACSADEPASAEAVAAPDLARPAAGTVNPENWPTLSAPFARDDAIEARLDDLLAEMSLEQKIGQIVQPDIASITPAEAAQYRIGSVLNGGNSAPGGQQYAAPTEWLALADEFYLASTDSSLPGPVIPLIWGSDAVHGHGNVIGATLFPHNVGLGAADNPDLMRGIGRVTALEMRVTGLDWTFAPTLAVARDDRWGRTYESYSEDPQRVTRYASTVIEGLQGPLQSDRFLDNSRVIATAKHFLADGGTELGRDQGDAQVTEADLKALHGTPYPAALSAGAQAVMASFSSWQGVKHHGNKSLLTGLLKERWGFDGFVVGDWNGHGQIPGCTNKNCPQALLAGLDMYMAPDSWRGLYDSLLEQAKSGEIPAERLNDAVRRILRVKLRAGLFDAPKPSERPHAGDLSLLGSPDHRLMARMAVRESLVLLKNQDGVLPLKPTGRYLVTGEGADNISQQSGGWTLTWQGTDLTNADFPGATSIFAGLQQAVSAAGGELILDPEGTGDHGNIDGAIVVFGEQPYAEFKGDRDHVAFAPQAAGHLTTLRHLADNKVPVISVFLTGRPLWVNPEINLSDAFVVAWLPGSEGGGVADVLFGSEDFKGTLPMSWPANAAQTPLNSGDGQTPQFPLGYGLKFADTQWNGPLSEDPKVDNLGGSADTLLMKGKAAPGWQLLMISQGQVAQLGDGPGNLDNGALSARPVDVGGQEDAWRVQWSGSSPALMTLAGDGQKNWMRESNGDVALALTMEVQAIDPRTTVNLMVMCGAGCMASVPVTAGVQQLTTDSSLATLSLPLKCFAAAGADMTAITAVQIASGGPLTLDLSSVTLASASPNDTNCPDLAGDTP
ncbi:MAG: glycoside hydrolase family 3 N-terminal domain-containing protein [Lysobacterales bacterium]